MAAAPHDTGVGERAVVVTGGASGLGAATAELLTAEGWRVAVVDIADTDGGALALTADVSDPEQVRHAVDQAAEAFGRLDAVVSCAGTFRNTLSPCHLLEDDAWHRTLAVNLTGAFFVAKAAGADDLIDAVVPRAAVPGFLATVADLAGRHGALVSACGHVGDGNVHLSVFLADAARRARLLRQVLAAAVEAGGAVSGEHGIGTEKLSYFLELEDPAKLELMRAIKTAFDPHGILGPGRLGSGAVALESVP